MSNRKIGWAFSAERPVSVQSPSMMPLSDIQTKLNFSTSKSPSNLLKKKPLINISKSPRTPLTRGSYTLRSMNSRVADYHMSKQNPDVLDRVHSSATPQNGYSPFGSQVVATSPLYNSAPNSTSSTPGYSFQNHRSHSPLQMSLLRQTLKASKSTKAPRSSLVQLATQRSSVRLNSGTTVSPVVVRLSRGSDTLPSMGARSKEDMVNGNIGGDKVENPCDKDSVLLALRSKRKRWTSSALDESCSSVLLASGQPSTKRSKHEMQDTVSPPTGRKRRHELTANPDQSSITNKRSKVAKPVPKRVNRIRMPDIEYESETEYTPCDDPMPNSAKVPATIQASSQTLVNGSNKKSPHLVPVDEDMVKKREDSLSKLRTVFPSAKSEKSFRREVPVFCATGHKPHMPSPLSSAYTPTREDLLKDREAAAKKLEQFLANNDNAKRTLSTSTVTSTSTTVLSSTGLKSNLTLEQSKSVSNLNSVSTNAPVSTSTKQTTASVKEGLKLSSVSGKSVSFANPVTSSLPSATTTASSTTGVSISASVAQNLPQIELQASVGSSGLSSTSGTPSLDSSTAQPSSTAIENQTAATLSPTQGTTDNALKLGTGTGGFLSSGLKFGTESNRPAATTTTVATLGTSASTTKAIFGNSTAQSVMQANGMQFGALNATVSGSSQGLSTTQSGGGFMFGNSATSTVTAQQSTGGVSFGTNATAGSSTTNSTMPLKTSSNPKLPLISLTPVNPIGIQQPVSGLFQGSNSQGSGVGSNSQGSGLSQECVKQPTGGLLFGNNAAITTLNPSGAPGATPATTTTQQTSGLLFGSSMSLTGSTQSTGGLLFGNSSSSASNTQQSTSSLLFGNSASSASNPQQLTSGLLLGNNANSTSCTQQPTGGLSFGNSANSASNSQQSTSGLLFGNSANSSSNTQQSTGGLLFGNSGNSTGVTQQSSSGNFSGGSTTAKLQSVSGGLSFGSSGATGLNVSNSTQPSSGLMFGNKVTSSSGFSFTASQTTQNSIFGSQAKSEAPKPTTGLLFGSNNTQSTSNPSNTFNFTANGGKQQQSVLSGGNNAQQPMAFSFGASQSQSSTQPQNSVFGGGVSGITQNQSGSMFGGALNSATQSQGSNSGFNFSAGTSNRLQQKSGAGGQQSFGQTASTGLSFGIGQSQNGNGSNAFSSNSNGQTGLNSANTSGMNSGQGLAAGNIFNSPQPSNPGGFQFTPQQSSQQGFNFSINTPNQSGFNFSVATPTPSPFTAGTQGEAGSRNSSNRARRRVRKK